MFYVVQDSITDLFPQLIIDKGNLMRCAIDERNYYVHLIFGQGNFPKFTIDN